MKYLILLVIISSCSQAPIRNKEELVSIDAALNQAQASYLLGCVEAFKSIKMPVVFPRCRDKSLIHREELDQRIGQDL